MPRRNGSLAAHALVVCAGGAATVGAIALVAAWWAADRVAESAGVPVAGKGASRAA